MAWLYDASLGRYTQPDPLSLVDGPNRYAYAASAPTLYTDPRGEYLIPVLVGAAVGAGIDLGFQLWQHGGRFDCVDWKEVVFSGAAGALGGGVTRVALRGGVTRVAGVKVWYSPRARGGGINFRDRFKVDWHRFKLKGRWVNRPHYHRYSESKRSIESHRPWQRGW